MVRGKQAEPAEKKVTPPKKAAAVKATPAKAAPTKTEESEDVPVEEVPADGEAVAEGEEQAEGEGGEEHAEGEGGEEHAEGEEQEGAAEDGEGTKADKEPLTEECLAYIAELLTTKIKLKDDTETAVFSYGPPKVGVDNPYRSVVCHLCRVANLQTPAGIKAHLQGKRHAEYLKKSTLKAERFKKPYLMFYTRDGDKVKQFKIFPGENIETVTPELEDRIVDKVDWEFKKIEDEKLLKALSEDPVYEYNKTKPVIGLDYLLKMKHRGKFRRFCVLCETFLPHDTYSHVVDIKHQATYIIKHFPKLYEKVVAGLTMTNSQQKENCLRNIFRKLYRKIEIKHGFKKMIPVDAVEFFGLRARYINKVRRMPHYSEETLQFTDAEVNILIKKSNNNISFNEPDPPSLNAKGNVPEQRKRGAADALQSAQPTKIRRVGDGDLLQVWRKYKTIKDKRIDRLKLQYKKYEKDPKLHPSYQKEWSQFWHRRCGELKKANINPDTYNFDKEWLPHWEKRLRRLFSKDVTDRKTHLRKRFGLPARTNTPTRMLRTGPLNPMGNVQQPMMGQGPMRGNLGNFGLPNLANMDNFVPPFNNNQQNSNNYGRGGVGGGAGVGGGSGRGGPRNDGNRQRQGNRNVQPQQQQQKRAPQQQRQQPQQAQPQQQRLAKKIYSEPASVVSCLRLLTALEDQLGSLGPKCVQLLGKAILCNENEKKGLLADSELYILFATAKEKLKGKILANVIEDSKMAGVNRAIEDLTTIIRKMDKEKRSRGGVNNQNANSGGGNSYGGDNYARNNMGGGNNDRYTGNGNNDNYRGGGGMNNDGNFRNDGGNFGGNDNYRSNNDLFGSGGGGYGNGNANNRMNSSSNYDGGNFGGNYRNLNDNGNFSNANSNMGAGNYRSNNDDLGNFRGGSGGNFNDGGNYRSNGNFGSSNNNSALSGYRGGNDNSGSGSYGNNASGLSSSFSSNTNQYRSGGNFGNNDNYNAKPSNNYGSGGGTNNSSSAQRGNWMGGSGNVYSNQSKTNTSATPLFSTGLGGGLSNQSKSFSSFSSNNRNSSSNFGSVGGGGNNYRRYN